MVLSGICNSHHIYLSIVFTPPPYSQACFLISNHLCVHPGTPWPVMQCKGMLELVSIVSVIPPWFKAPVTNIATAGRRAAGCAIYRDHMILLGRASRPILHCQLDRIGNTPVIARGIGVIYRRCGNRGKPWV